MRLTWNRCKWKYIIPLNSVFLRQINSAILISCKSFCWIAAVSFFCTFRTDSCLHRNTRLKDCKYSRVGTRHMVLWDSACGFGGVSADTKPELMPGILQNTQSCLFCKIISKWLWLWVMLNLPSLKASKLKFSRAGTLHILMQHCLPFIDVRTAENKSQGHESHRKYQQNKNEHLFAGKNAFQGRRQWQKKTQHFNRYPDKLIIYIWNAFSNTVCQMLVKMTSSKKTPINKIYELPLCIHHH